MVSGYVALFSLGTERQGHSAKVIYKGAHTHTHIHKGILVYFNVLCTLLLASIFHYTNYFFSFLFSNLTKKSYFICTCLAMRVNTFSNLLVILLFS